MLNGIKYYREKIKQDKADGKERRKGRQGINLNQLSRMIPWRRWEQNLKEVSEQAKPC